MRGFTDIAVSAKGAEGFVALNRKQLSGTRGVSWPGRINMCYGRWMRKLVGGVTTMKPLKQNYKVGAYILQA